MIGDVARVRCGHHVEGMDRASLLGKGVFVALSALLAAGCATRTPALVSPAAGVLPAAPHSREVLPLSSGDPARGRIAFIDLQCHACHRVAEDERLPVRSDAWEGPVLHDLGKESAEAVGWRIVTRTELGPEALYESEMVEAASRMTNEQLVDIIAYLRDPAAGAAE